MAFPVVGVIIATVLLVLYLKLKKNKNGSDFGKNLKKLPGPYGLPFIGNGLQLGKYPSKAFCRWSKEYGDIYQVMLGRQKVVVVSEPKLSKEMFSLDPAYTGKPDFGATGFDLFPGESRLGMFNSEGEAWEVHRRFLLRQLRDFGFGKSAMESLIMDEVNEVLSSFQEKSLKGESITKVRETLRLAVVNSLWTILTSKRFKHDDPELLQLTLNTTQVFNDVIEAGSVLLFVPWLGPILPGLTGYKNVEKVMRENREVFTRAVREHKEAFKPEDLNDFIDVYLAEVKKTTDPNSAFYGEKAEMFLANTLFDLFIAGTDTTATTVSWTVLYMSAFQDYQKKLQKEIDDVVGNSRTVSVADRTAMPFTLALIDEVLRYSSMVPDGVQHRVMADREFHGYFIPKDTWVQPNLYYIHHDPKIWGDPENFRPERFLSPDGKKYIKNENLQAFQVGRRQCVGETLARDSIFLYTTNLFQKFDVKFDPKKEEPSLESDIGFLRSPLPYHVVMKERSKAGK